jgi:hypothetical protein
MGRSRNGGIRTGPRTKEKGMTDKCGTIKNPDDVSGEAFLLYSDKREPSAARADRQGLEATL